MQRIFFYLMAVVLVVLGGCAHSGAISKSPCACQFHPLPYQA